MLRSAILCRLGAGALWVVGRGGCWVCKKVAFPGLVLGFAYLLGLFFFLYFHYWLSFISACSCQPSIHHFCVLYSDTLSPQSEPQHGFNHHRTPGYHSNILSTTSPHLLYSLHRCHDPQGSNRHLLAPLYRCPLWHAPTSSPHFLSSL